MKRFNIRCFFGLHKWLHYLNSKTKRQCQRCQKRQMRAYLTTNWFDY